MTVEPLEFVFIVTPGGKSRRDAVFTAVDQATDRFGGISIVVSEADGKLQSGSICAAVIYDRAASAVMAHVEVAAYENAPHGPTYEWDTEHAVLDARIRKGDESTLVPTLVEVFTYWLREVFERLRGPTTLEQQLRSAVEILAGLIRQQILENDELLNRLEERDQFIEQLKATVVALEVELRRAKVEPKRVWPAARLAGGLIATAVASFAGGVAARTDVVPLGEQAEHVQVVQLPEVDHQLAEVLRLCGAEAPPAAESPPSG